MATTTLYGFILDSSFREASRVVNTEVSVGELTGEPYNYLVDKVVVNDPRDSRSNISNTATYAAGKLGFIFDAARFPAEIFLESALSSDVLSRFFNVLDKLMFASSAAQAEDTIAVDDTLYAGYIAGSAKTSDAITIANCTVVDEDVSTRVEKTLRDWIEFKFQIGDTVYAFHFWIAKAAFAKSYPYVTITAVVPPVSLDILTDPAKLSRHTNLSMLQQSSNFIFGQANLETLSRDQNGVYTFSTKYVLDSTSVIRIPFALVYCGATPPGSLACRAAIREYLAANAMVSDSVLHEILPEIFITCRFTIVPLWDVYTQRTDRDVYNSIWKMTTIKEKAEKIFKDIEPEFTNTYLELLTNAQNKMISLAMPDPNNDGTMSVLEQNPTYQDYSTQVPGWKYMTAETQEFAGRLINVLTILRGDLVNSDYIFQTIAGVRYLTFCSGNAEYLVMTSESYNEIMTS